MNTPHYIQKSNKNWSYAKLIIKSVLLTSLSVSGSSFGLFAGSGSAAAGLRDAELSREASGWPKSSQPGVVLIAATASISTFIPSTLTASSKAEFVSLLTDIRRMSDDFCLALKCRGLKKKKERKDNLGGLCALLNINSKYKITNYRYTFINMAVCFI